MVKKTSFPKETIDNYIKNVSEKIKVDGVFLFGSFAYGRPTKHSDVDLIIISPNFKRMKNRIFWLSKQREGVATSIAMDVFGYTPKEFARAEEESAILTYAKKHGKWLYPLKH